MIADTQCYKQGFDIQGEEISLQQFSESFAPQKDPELAVRTARLNVASAGSDK